MKDYSESMTEEQLKKKNIHVEVKNGPADGAKYNKFILIAFNEDDTFSTIMQCDPIDAIKSPQVLKHAIGDLIDGLNPLELIRLDKFAKSTCNCDKCKEARKI